MIVKDFLLSLNLDTLSETYCKNHLSKDVILTEKAKESDFDLTIRSKELLERLMKQILEIIPEKTPNEYIMVLQYFDFDYTDELEMFKTFCYDAFILDKDECKKHGKMKLVQSLEEANKNEYVWIPYSLMFQSWEKVLGLEIGYLPDDTYAAAAAIIEELTFFGFDKQENDDRVKEETEELDKITAQIEAGEVEYVPFDSKEFRKEFNLPEEEPAKKAKEDALSLEIMIENINESYRVYNLLLEQGFFDDCN